MDYKARFYDPTIGRFTQPDTIIPDPVNPQNWNRFAYVLNNPIRLIDPTGYCSVGGHWMDDNSSACQWLKDNPAPLPPTPTPTPPPTKTPTQTPTPTQVPQYITNFTAGSGGSKPIDDGQPPTVTNKYGSAMLLIPLIVDVANQTLGTVAPPPPSNVSIYLNYGQQSNGDITDLVVTLDNRSDENVNLGLVRLDIKPGYNTGSVNHNSEGISEWLVDKSARPGQKLRTNICSNCIGTNVHGFPGFPIPKSMNINISVRIYTSIPGIGYAGLTYGTSIAP